MILLETERLVFRDHEPDDLESFCDMEADPEVRRFVGGKPRTRDAAAHKFRIVYLRPVQNRIGLCATVLKPDGRYIGYCGIYPHFGDAGPVGREASLAFYLARAYWGRGLATEAARAWVDAGFRELGLRRIVADVQVGNAASVRILEKLGFRLWRLEKTGARSYYHFELCDPLPSR